jgi:integrase
MATTTANRDRAFRIVEFIRPRTNEVSWRVTGTLRGLRIRENFPSRTQAEARRLELDQERLGQQSPEVLRATWLTAEQLRAAEAAFYRIPEPAELGKAVEWWQKKGRAHANALAASGRIKLDDAVTAFGRWIDSAVDLRPETRRNLRTRIRIFSGEIGNVPLDEITRDDIKGWLAKRAKAVSPVTANNDRRIISQFFNWCSAEDQRYLLENPCRAIKVAIPDKGPPEIYSVREVMRILVAARRFRGGRFLKGVVLGLFGGMRPFEASRFRDQQIVNGQTRVESVQSKTGRPRTIDIDPVLAAWLRECPPGTVIAPKDSGRLWGELKRKARLPRWIPDGLRHTAISHYFRRSGSYGLTAEWAGNSESVIREHYQARTTAAESEAFWRLFPTRAERLRARELSGTVVAFPPPTVLKRGRKR